MNSRTASPCPSSAHAAAPSSSVLSPRAAFWLLASITLSFLAGSSAPTPLYPLYQAAWGFSSIAVTVVFAVYALAVLAALLVLGRLSDHVGRRPVLIGAAAAQVVAMAVLGTADGLAALIVGRVVQGLSTGAAVAAVGAALLDLDRARGTVANAIAPILGTASGALLGGLMVHFLPAPTHMVYAALALVFVVQGAGIVRMRESVGPVGGAWRSLQPRFALPQPLRTPFLLAVPMLVATWALAGFYASLGPRLVHTQFGLDASLAGGLTLFLLASGGALGVLAMRDAPARAMTLVGELLLALGTAGVVAALGIGSEAGFFAGTLVAGVGFGAGFQGAVRSVVSLALPHERAGVLSVVFVVAYLAMGLPAVIAGAAIAEGAGILETARGFGEAVVLLATTALAATLVHRNGPRN